MSTSQNASSQNADTPTIGTGRIVSLVAPIVADLKLDLYDLEFKGGVLRITVDTPVGSNGGVTLDQLALVTRLVGRDLDHHDPIPGHYTLEVTSPGLERTLRTPAHFQREIGKTVTIRLRANTDGQRRLQGVLVAADETTATIRLDPGTPGPGEPLERVVAIDAIDRAKTVFQWEKGEKLTPSTGRPKPGAKNKPRVAAGGVKPPPGPSDELDQHVLDALTEQEATT